jgi:hypothetical protein
MNHWINLDKYTPAQLLLNGAGCAAWVVAYVALLIGIYRRKFVEMPALVAGANIGWEFVWSWLFKPDTGLLYLWMYRAAFLLDVVIFACLLAYGRKQPMPAAMRRHLPLIAVLDALAWGLLCYFYAAEGHDTPIGASSGYVINVFLSASALLMFLAAEDRSLFSPVIAWSKMLGTGLITVSLFLIYPGQYFIQLLGVLCFVLDITCIAAVHVSRRVSSVIAR